ncbi:AAA family ATPase [Candidatus Parcubacteria bacterium]|nr:AAA family ATPase [Candidatus Parcubacteria bacterium]
METIEIKKEYLPIKENFKLDNMKKMNVIVGRNSVGKTRFFEAIEKEYGKTLDIVFIRSNDVNPADNQFKSSAAASDLIKRVSKLFNNLNIEPELNNIDDIKLKLEKLVEKTNENFQEFISNKNISISNNIKSSIKIETVVQSLLDKFEIYEVGVEEKLDLKDIGQGYQRMLVASILKSYVDILKEIGTKEATSEDKEVLLLFEEPEIFLHPQLKRTLNKVLKIISEIPNYTVVISTHDPYFLWSNMNDEDIKIYSFIKNGNFTEPKEDEVSFEVEDEILHISLFNKLIKKMKKKGLGIGLGNRSGNTMEDTSTNMETFLDAGDIKKKIYKWNGNDYNVLLPIYMRNVLHHRGFDEYDDSDLEDSVKILNKILSNI